jgi:ATP-dependent RNA helicase DeaD
MAEGSVWFRAAIGRRKNAEARWLLPMICRRGGIDKQDIGAIRIMDTTTEFEISGRVADSFAVKIRRPDKEDNIRIEPLGDAPQDQAPSEQRPHAPRREGKEAGRSARQDDKPREERGPKPHDRPHGESGSRFGKDPSFAKKKRHQDKPAHGGQPQHASASPAKPTFGKKPKKKHRG